MIINAEDFKKYLNEDNLKIDEPQQLLVETKFSNRSKSSILITNDADYREQINIEFIMKFKHHQYQDENVFQRDFSIEHHPLGKSDHDKPHLQIKIHGPAKEDKIGKIWLTLILNEDDDDLEYEKCIKGFMCVLEEITEICKEGLDKELLDLKQIEELKPDKEFLMYKIKESLETDGIEFLSAEDGSKRNFVTGKDISDIIKLDKILKPLLTFQ